MQNVSELREQLSDVFNDLRNGTIKSTDAAEFANLAGKMINSAKVQIEYMNMRKISKPIDFLEAK